MRHFVRHLTRPVAHWAGVSQRRACRNAMLASTSLTAGRQERDDVQHVVDQLLAQRDRPDVAEVQRPSGIW